MIESEHWMTPLKNRCGNYGSLMKTRPREIPLVGQRARAGVPRAGASPAPTIHDRIVSFARKSNGQSYRDMVPRAGASPAPTIHDRIISFARKSNGQSYR